MWEISIRVLLHLKKIRNIYTDPENPDKLKSMWPEVLKRLVGLTDNNFTCVVYGPLMKFFNALPKSNYNKMIQIFEEVKAEFHVSTYSSMPLLTNIYLRLADHTPDHN